MKAEATTLRAAGSDPNNPKVIAVNLQRAQMVAIIVALINARDHTSHRVSTDQTVDMLLQNQESKSSNNSCVVSEELINMFRSQKDLEKDMLGHCFLLSLTFMDLCVYKNQERIAKLLKRGD
ncbi:Uncharacterized protein OBRU01_01052 [Operophtera brumata]|uniref:Uncharacterized protein n=1 Tax=Operophtera brumata TaxID=104452 RepID=A0A0L7LUI4_OPEBR|nr:Uncharacterized protein OBRU01_01052 [Operophtera brumata]